MQSQASATVCKLSIWYITWLIRFPFGKRSLPPYGLSLFYVCGETLVKQGNMIHLVQLWWDCVSGGGESIWEDGEASKALVTEVQLLNELSNFACARTTEKHGWFMWQKVRSRMDQELRTHSILLSLLPLLRWNLWPGAEVWAGDGGAPPCGIRDATARAHRRGLFHYVHSSRGSKSMT